MTTTVSTAVRVIYSVHNYSTNRWSDSLAAVAAGFADLDVLVLDVTDIADVRHAIKVNHADFAAWKANLTINFVLSDKLSATTSAAG